MSAFESFERFMATAIAVVVISAVGLRGVNRLLVWMDEKDWILIPNREAVKHAERSLARGFLDVQAIIEPSKRHVIQQEEDEEVKEAEDGQGDGDDPGPGAG